MGQRIELRPQAGPQEQFLTSPADIAIYGGRAGAGKSYALLLEPLRHCRVRGFGAIAFRRTTPELTGEGGLWEEARGIYPHCGAKMREHPSLDCRFPSGARIQFSHLERDSDKYTHHGRAYALILWDELTHFLESQFWYLLSRNRSTSGVRPYMRATTNPDASSWVRKLIAWWIGPDGKAIPERFGVLRWFVRDGDDLVWADSPEELRTEYPEETPLSLTFIAATLNDNRILMERDPAYKSKLQALPRVERARLLDGDWDIMPTAGEVFQRSWFKVVEAAPTDVMHRVRAWDKAGTEKKKGGDPDWTVGVLMSKTKGGSIYIEHVERFRGSPGEVDRRMRNTAEQDGQDVTIAVWQDPGQAGKVDVAHMARLLEGYTVRSMVAAKDKISYAGPVSAQAEQGNVCLVRSTWNDAFLSEHESFPDGKHDDQVDATSRGYIELTSRRIVKLSSLANLDGGRRVSPWGF